MKKAFVTGVTGQDGAYLASFLLAKGYRVFGGYRRSSSQTFWRLSALGVMACENFSLVEHDLTDFGSCIRVLATTAPEEVYNLAAQSFVGVSFIQPTTTFEISGLGALHMLEAVRIVNPKIRFYQASSAEMFGKVQSVPQNEDTAFYPRSPYAVAKLFAHWSTVNYRESYGIFAASGILFNHESPLRGPEFVTRKISQGAARISLGQQSLMKLGNLDAKRDWGFAGEFVEGMWRMLQVSEPGTFVLATGITTTVRDFATQSFEAAGINLEWINSGDFEVGRCAESGRRIVVVDPTLRRPAEVELLVGDASRAQNILGWTPVTTTRELSQLMVTADLARERSLS